MTIIDVVDGDTVDIRFENGTIDTVRLLGVDTPEVYGTVSPDEFEGVPDTEAGRECLRDWGSEASGFARESLDGQEVTLRFDEQSDRRGTFDRLLAYVVVDGENFNYRLVADGYARVYDSTFTQSDRFYDAETDAQETETGLWACRSVSTPTQTPDAGDSGLTVVEIHEDAAGNDNENLNDEYVVFRNDGEDTLDLTGWSVEDEADHTYAFPDGFTLDPGEEVTLHTGSGDDTDTDLYWGSGRAIWNNGGDTVYVFDDAGASVVEKSYGSLTVTLGVAAAGGLFVVVVLVRRR